MWLLATQPRTALPERRPPSTLSCLDLPGPGEVRTATAERPGGAPPEAVFNIKELKDQGKIRAIGVSNFSIDQLKEANQDGYVDVYQGEYNLLQRSAETEFLPYAAEHHISYVPYFPLASGLLAGKYNKDTTFEDSRSKKPQFQGDAFISNLEKVDRVRDIASSKGVEVSDVVLAWYLQQPAIDVLIPGAKKT